jgi:hypothetical protein
MAFSVLVWLRSTARSPPEGSSRASRIVGIDGGVVSVAVVLLATALVT